MAALNSFAPPPAVRNNSAAPPPAVRTHTVLVVDDNSALRQTAEAMLAADGRHCIAVADSITALCALVEHQPQVVLLDADSGPLLAWQFARLLQQHPVHKGTRLIYTSTRDDVIERARALAAGIEQFLPKPFTTEELLAAVAGNLASAA